MQADYTRKTQEIAQRSQEAGQYQAIVEGLEDPERAPEILRILGIDAGNEDEDWLLDEEELYGPDPNQPCPLTMNVAPGEFACPFPLTVTA